MNKLIYNYDPATGAYVSTSIAETSPREPGVFLIPAHATEIAPPEREPLTWPVFDAITATWSLVPDHRGGVYYSTATGQRVEITDLGKTPADLGLTDQEPPAGPVVFVAGAWQRDVAAAKAEIWDRIKAERDRRTQAGGYQAGGKWFHSDTFSRTQQIGLVMLGAGIPPGMMWKTMDGSFIEMTPTLAQQVFAAAAAQDLATFAAAEAHKAAMEAAADPADYDFSTGWAAVFGG